MQVKTIIKDAILVTPRVSLVGGVNYRHKNIRTIDSGENGPKEIKEWETIRETFDPNELKNGHRVRTSIVRRLQRLGSVTEIGVVIPEENEADLQDWYEDAGREVATYNATAAWSKMTVNYAAFAVRADNERAVRTIAAEIRELLDKVKDAVQEVDVLKMREVVRRMEGFKDIVVPDMRGRIVRVINEIRDGATNAVAILRKTEGDIDEARKGITMLGVDMARFAIDEAVPEEEFEVLDAGTAGGGFEMGSDESNFDAMV